MKFPDKSRLLLVAHGLLVVMLSGLGLTVNGGPMDLPLPDPFPPTAILEQAPEPAPEPPPIRTYPLGEMARRAGVQPAFFAPPGPRPPETSRETTPREDGKAQLAIVIDDIGHSVEVLQEFLALDVPLTFAVLPGVPYTSETAALIREAGREFIIHLPMEPFAYPHKDPGPGPLLLSQGRGETARRLRAYIAALPGAVGASNHMGSAYTYDADRMAVVQTVLDEKRLFFLNSRTSATPVPEQIARQWGYRYLERDVFLDHDPALAAVERYYGLAVRQAGARGHAIAIGHPYPQTLRVLKHNLPRLAKEGVRLVPLSALLGR